MKKIFKHTPNIFTINFHSHSFLKKQSPQNILRYTVKELYRQQNWDGLRKYLTLLDERKMLPKSYKWLIANAFILQNKIHDGLDYLYKLHTKDPLQPDIQLTIFDALNKLGKSEFSFNWIKKPEIHHVEFDSIQKCYKIISKSGSPIPLFILYSELTKNCSKEFDEFDLLYYLKKDSRFHIFNDTCYFRYSRISLNAKAERHAA